MPNSIQSPKQNGFSQKQLIGVLILSILIVVSVAAWRLWPYFNEEPITNISDSEEILVQSIEENNEAIVTDHRTTFESSSSKERNFNSEIKPQLFTFNPNTATQEDFIRLGLSPRVSATIIKYRSKGGYFKDRDDFSKIYTLSEEDFKRLRPYISIPARSNSNTYAQSDWKNDNSSNNERTNNAHGNYTKSEKPVNLNTCNENDLMQLRGIGPAYAGRIIKYRDLLGGYQNVDQLKEVYGMNDSLFALIKDKMIIHPEYTKKININTATEEELYSHPYIKRMAKNIILYRNDIGQFKTIEDFRAVPLINEEKYRKIAPYLTL